MATVLREDLPVELRADLDDSFFDDVERLLLALARSGKIVTKDVRRTRTTEAVPARASLIINPFLLHATPRGPGGKFLTGATAADKKRRKCRLHLRSPGGSHTKGSVANLLAAHNIIFCRA